MLFLILLMHLQLQSKITIEIVFIQLVLTNIKDVQTFCSICLSNQVISICTQILLRFRTTIKSTHVSKIKTKKSILDSTKILFTSSKKPFYNLNCNKSKRTLQLKLKNTSKKYWKQKTIKIIHHFTQLQKMDAQLSSI